MLTIGQFKSIISIIVILLGFVLSGCTGSQDVTPEIKALPEVQQFMKEHPNAKITVTYWSKEEVAKSIQEISQQCDKSITPVAMYKATVIEEDLRIVAWIDAEKRIVICSTEGKSTATSIQTQPTSQPTKTQLAATPTATPTPTPPSTPSSVTTVPTPLLPVTTTSTISSVTTVPMPSLPVPPPPKSILPTTTVPTPQLPMPTGTIPDITVPTPKFPMPIVPMDFVPIRVGEFDMGSPSNEVGRDDDEGPVHHVKLAKAFYMGKYEITQKQWREIMGNNPSYFKGDNLPVEQVSWDDVNRFIQRLNQKEGTTKYRLPSEAEWEYAARAGTTTRYYFGDAESKLGDFAWYDSNSNGTTHPVGQKNSNSWGLYDMYGNVREWVQDSYHSSYNGAPIDGSVWENGGIAFRVCRGGSWHGYASNSRSASRNGYDPANNYNHLGFRLVKDL